MTGRREDRQEKGDRMTGRSEVRQEERILRNPAIAEGPSRNGDLTRKRAADRKLILILLLVSALLLGVRTMYSRLRPSSVPASGPFSSPSVVVSVNGETVRTLPLSETHEEVFRTSSGGSNTLHIQGGKAWVTDASCPDHICEKTGQISEAGEVIVCMPNRLIVQIVAQ